MKDLRMFNAEPMVGCGRLLERGLERVEDFTVATVANGVGVELESAAQRANRDILNARDRRRDEAGIPGASLYGSSNAAPREPSAPSTTILMDRIQMRESYSADWGPRRKYRASVESSLAIMM